MNASTVPGSGGACPDTRAPVVVVAFPLRDQRIAMRLQRGVDLGRLGVGSVIRHVVDCSSLVVLIDRCRSGCGSGCGSRFELDRGAQLADRGAARQLRVVLIRALGRPPAITPT